ncbi:MAG: HK97 gp10 family phage protein [Desulfobacterales bacterium]|nr:HK97 gp10 family phage protein [Desulfobacterales bacterium]
MDITGFLAWADNEPERVNRIMTFIRQEGSDVVHEEMIRHMPERTGFMKQNIDVVFTETGFAVIATASYALFVERGTGIWGRGPYPIVAKKAKALHFEWMGREWFLKRVWHPGFPGRFFAVKTKETSKPRIFDIVSQLWRDLHVV